MAHRREAEDVLAAALGNPALFVIAGAIIDVALGVGLLWRPSSRVAAWGMMAVTMAYLVAGTIFTPHLWADPLGPLVKPIPAALLALVCVALLEER